MASPERRAVAREAPHGHEVINHVAAKAHDHAVERGPFREGLQDTEADGECEGGGGSRPRTGLEEGAQSVGTKCHRGQGRQLLASDCGEPKQGAAQQA